MEKNIEKISNKEIYHNPNLHRYNISIAPMLEITNKHYMSFMRLLTKQTLIYSEMINVNEILNNKSYNPLDFSYDLNPIVIQFGANDPIKCALASQKVKEMGCISELNLNVGCPSHKVSMGNYGAVLMDKPEVVGECLKNMNKYLFSSIKCRIGLNEFDEDYLYNFIEKTKKIGGVSKYIIHSRIAIMGIDTMKNRSVPPLRYDIVEKVKEKYSDLNIVLNGGIKDFEDVLKYNEKGIGVMIGRLAYEEPWKFRVVDEKIFGKHRRLINRKQLVYEYADYCESFIDKCSSFKGETLNGFIKPLTNLFVGEKFCKKFIGDLYAITQNIRGKNKESKLIERYHGLKDSLYKVIEDYEAKNEEAVFST